MSEFYVWQKGENPKLSKNFSGKEFTCKGTKCGCTTQRISKQVIDNLQQLRDDFGPIEITSGYRCIEHNRSIGSKDTSTHVKGTGVDFRPNGFNLRINKEFDLKVLRDMAKKLFNGIGVHPRFIHGDTRVKKAEWRY